MVTNKEKFQEALSKIYNKDALDFINRFNIYCHRIDDIIDEKITDSEYLLQTFVMAAEVYGHKYFIENREFITAFVVNITNDYADSVIFEQCKDKDSWKCKHADVLRHAGYKMLFAILYRECGYNVLRELSPIIREENLV